MSEDGYAASGRGMSGSAVAFLVGAVVGAGVALLMAPASGSKSRKILSRKLRDWGEAARDGVDRVHDELERHVEDLKPHLNAAVRKGHEAVESGREAIEDAREEARHSTTRRHD